MIRLKIIFCKIQGNLVCEQSDILIRANYIHLFKVSGLNITKIHYHEKVKKVVKLVENLVQSCFADDFCLAHSVVMPIQLRKRPVWWQTRSSKLVFSSDHERPLLALTSQSGLMLDCPVLQFKSNSTL
jgi:hypothetical protein